VTTDASKLPHVSIVIPTRGDTSRVWGAATCLVENTVHNIVQNSTYPSFDIVVVRDVNSDGSMVHPFTMPAQKNIQCINFFGDFNIATKWNVGVLASRGEIVVVLDDDTQITSPDWLEQLVGQFQFPSVGATGPMLQLEDGRVFSAGMSLQPKPRQISKGESSTHIGWMGIHSVARTVTAVSGACMAFRRSAFDEVGGFSENYQYSYADVDFCLKLKSNNLGTVWTPEAKVYHFDARTRGDKSADSDQSVFEKRWGRFCSEDAYTRSNA